MKRGVQLFIFLILCSSTLYPDYRRDLVELSGRVLEFNEEYVILLQKDHRKSYATRSAISVAQLKSKEEITLYVPFKDYLNVVELIKKRKRRK